MDGSRSSLLRPFCGSYSGNLVCFPEFLLEFGYFLDKLALILHEPNRILCRTFQYCLDTISA